MNSMKRVRTQNLVIASPAIPLVGILVMMKWKVDVRNNCWEVFLIFVMILGSWDEANSQDDKLFWSYRLLHIVVRWTYIEGFFIVLENLDFFFFLMQTFATNSGPIKILFSTLHSGLLYEKVILTSQQTLLACNTSTLSKRTGRMKVAFSITEYISF